MSETRRAVPNNVIAQAVRGFVYPFEALGFISNHDLWRLAMASIAVNVLLLGALVGVAYYVVAPWLTGAESAILGFSAYESWRIVAPIIVWLFWLLALLLLLAANAFVLLLIGQAVASPFLDALSERVESIALGAPSYPFSIGRVVKSVLVALSDLVWSIAFLAAVSLPIWFLSLVLPFLSPVAFLLNALILAQEFVGLPLSRQLVGYRRRWRIVWRNKGLTAGFGTAVTLMVVVPVLNLVLLPLAAVGGTLLYCDLKSAGRVDIGGAAAAAAGGSSAPLH